MNPVSYARHLTTFSTTALAKRLSVSRQYLSRLEQGLYDKPNGTLTSWTASVLNKHLDKPVSAADVEEAYQQWQWEKRNSVKKNLVLRPCSVTEYDRVRQPEIIYYHRVFKMWREGYWTSTHAFCVDMCLHPSPVTDYEEGNTQSMPSNLKAVMRGLNLIGEGFKINER